MTMKGITKNSTKTQTLNLCNKFIAICCRYLLLLSFFIHARFIDIILHFSVEISHFTLKDELIYYRLEENCTPNKWIKKINRDEKQKKIIIMINLVIEKNYYRN